MDFDFTLLFEQSILSILPSGLFIILAVSRLYYLSKCQILVKTSALYRSKLTVAAVLVCVQVASLTLWATSAPNTITRASIAAASLGLVDAIALVVLLHMEHIRSVRPSTVGLIWLLFSLMFDAVQVRSLYLAQAYTAVAILASITIALKCLLLLLEASQKSAILKDRARKLSLEELSSTFSRDFFWWLSGLFLQGYNSVLTVSDLDDVDNDMSSDQRHQQFALNWNYYRATGKKRPLMWTIIQSTVKFFMLPILPRLLLTALTFAQPFLVNAAIKYIGAQNATQNSGYGLIGAFALVYALIAISKARYWLYVHRWAVQVRGNLVSLIFSKSMKLKYAGAGDKAAVTLMSTDIERITMGMTIIHEYWVSAIEVAMAIWLLARQVSYAVVGPVGLVIVSSIVAGSIGAPAAARSKFWLAIVQKRVAATNDYLGSIRAYRMAGLEKAISSGLHHLRTLDVAALVRFRDLLVVGLVIAWTTKIIGPFLTFASYTGITLHSHDVLDSARLFTALSILSLLASPLASLLQTFPILVASFASVGRIEEFCVLQDQQDTRIFRDPETEIKASSLETMLDKSPDLREDDRLIAVNIEQASFAWDDQRTVRVPNFSAAYSQLVAVSGPNGSGKSTFLKALLGELPSTTGCFSLGAREIAFCDQTPWLPNGTIQKCILGYSLFNARIYDEVIHVCALDEDLEQLDDGDQTKIGSKGATRISGGQMQRIALARALYSRKRIYLLDDVLSGLDNRTERIIFHRLFGPDGYLRRASAATILVSNLPRQLQQADHVYVLGDDGLLSQKSSGDLAVRTEGTQDSAHKIDNSELYGVIPVMRKARVFGDTASTRMNNAEEAKSRQIGDKSVYRYYAKSVGSVRCAVFMVSLVFVIFFVKFPEIWMKMWAASNDTKPNQDIGKWLGVFGFLVVAALSTSGLVSWYYFCRVIAVSGLSLHGILLQAMARAPMSFFASTDSGETINRFSQDLSLIDQELPVAVFNTVATTLVVLSAVIFISISSGYVGLCIPPVIITLYVIQRFYLRTSKQIRLLDLESKAPLYTHFTESAAGLATIRAFDWTKECKAHHEELLAYSQRPFYLLYAIQQCLSLVLDLVVAAIAVLTMGIAVGLHGRVSAGFMGVALVNITGLSIELNAVIGNWTQMEASMGSIARIKAISETTSATWPGNEEHHPPEDWPLVGNVEFRSVYCSGGNEKQDQNILKNITLSFRAGDKIAICGRTGSGKSTLAGLLFRLMDASQGEVLIDGINIASIAASHLRSRLIGMAQEPCILPGTVRANLTSDGPDDDLIQVLSRFGLWQSIEARGGLDTEMTNEILSHGQRQLFCFIRAFLRQSKVVVLDEATSSMTEDMEATVMEAIQEQWKERTVISVVHRLRSVHSFDKVVVLREGSVLEFDSPENLLATQSEFRKIYEMEGKELQ